MFWFCQCSIVYISNSVSVSRTNTCVSLFYFDSRKKYWSFCDVQRFCCTATVCVSSIVLRDIYRMNPVQILGPIAISSLICTYFILELYYAMGVMTIDDYILAYISFYIDLAYPINCLHHLCEISENVDDFTEYFNPDPFTSRGWNTIAKISVIKQVMLLIYHDGILGSQELIECAVFIYKRPRIEISHNDTINIQKSIIGKQ